MNPIADLCNKAANDKTVLHFEDSEVLVAANQLKGLVGVETMQNIATSYLHLMFDAHEVLLSDGCWSESFQPDVAALVGVGNAQRIEILEVFPELATKEGIARYTPARRSASRREAALLK